MSQILTHPLPPVYTCRVGFDIVTAQTTYDKVFYKAPKLKLWFLYLAVHKGVEGARLMGDTWAS